MRSRFWRWTWLANLRSSKKDITRSRQRRLRNASWSSRLKTVSRKARAAISSGDVALASQLTRQACRLLDKAVTKGVIHRRQAARRKSRLASRLASMAQPTEA